MKIAYEHLQCCANCLVYIANGDVTEERPDIAEDIAREWDLNKYTLVIGDSEEDSEFSSMECDACGSRLAGSRHDFSVLEG